MNTEFEWDNQKAASNIKRHGVSFEEAMTVFDNPLALIFDDSEHSITEEREIIIGHSLRGMLLIICFTECLTGVVRIISARQATRKEQHDYETHITF